MLPVVIPLQYCNTAGCINESFNLKPTTSMKFIVVRPLTLFKHSSLWFQFPFYVHVGRKVIVLTSYEDKVLLRLEFSIKQLSIVYYF